MFNEEQKVKILNLIKPHRSDNPISSVNIYEQLLRIGYLNGQSKESFRADFRGLINEFRQTKIRILADTRGYWLASSDQEVIEYLQRAKHRWFEMRKGMTGLEKTLPKDAFTWDMFEKEEKQV